MNEQQTTSPGQRPWLSLFLDFSEQPCLLVGGGVIAARKLERLLAANTRITLVAPQLRWQTHRQSSFQHLLHGR